MKIIGNRYELKEKLGEGHFGKTYKALDLSNGVMKIVRLLHPERILGRSIEDFKRDFRMLLRLKHDNLISFYDFGYTKSEEPYYTFEYCKGGNLGNFPKQFDLKRITAIGIQICGALQYLHSQGVIHGNLKISNILIDTLPTDKTEARILMTDHYLLRSRPLHDWVKGKQHMNNLMYLPPEAITCASMDHRGDLYSLGVVLYHLATGQMPFNNEDPLTMIRHKLKGQVTSIRKINPDLPILLDEIILKLLNRDPSNRYASAKEVFNHLEAFAYPSIIDEFKKTAQSHLYNKKLIGRNEELGTFKELLTRVLEKELKFILIRGEEGIGKTRLAEEFRLIAQSQGFNVFTISVQKEYGPLQVFQELFHQVFSSIRHGKSEKLILRDELERFGDLFFGNKPLTGIQLPASRQRMTWFNCGATLLHELSSIPLNLAEGYKKSEMVPRYPIFISIDNIQDIDDYSLQFLQFILRNFRFSHLVFVLCLRDPVDMDKKPGLSNILDAAREDGVLTELFLSKLSEANAHDLIVSLLEMDQTPEGFSKLIHEHSRGNPLMLTETLKLLVEENQVYFEEGTWWINASDLSEIKLPKKLEETMTRRLEKLGVRNLELLQWIAPIGLRCSYEMLSTLTKGDENRLMDVLRQFLRLQILRQVWGLKPEFYEFTSPKFQELLLQRQTLKELRQTHTLAARSRPKDTSILPGLRASVIAYHYNQIKNKKQAAKHFKRAAKIAARFSDNSGQAYFLWKSFQESGTFESVDKKLNSMETIVNLLIQENQFDQAIPIISSALNEIKNEGLSDSAMCSFLMYTGDIKVNQEKWKEAITEYEKALSLLENNTENGIWVNLHSKLIDASLKIGNLEMAEKYNKALMEKALAYQSRSEVALAHRLTGEIFYSRGNFDQATEQFLKSLILEQEEKNIFNAAILLKKLGSAYEEKGEIDLAIGYYQRELETCMDLHDLEGQAEAHQRLGLVYWKNLNFESGRKHLTKSHQFYKLIGNFTEEAKIYMLLGALLVDNSEFDMAIHAYNQALSIFSKSNLPEGVGSVYQELGKLSLKQKEYEAAIRYFEQAYKVLEDSENNRAIIDNLLLLGEFYLTTHNFPKAEDFLLSAAQEAHNLGDYRLIGVTNRYLGQLYFAKGDKGKASDAFRNSILLLTDARADMELAEVYEQMGRCHFEMEQHHESLERLKAAHSIYQRIGASLRVEEIKGLMEKVSEKLLPYSERIPSDKKRLINLYRMGQELQSVSDMSSLYPFVLDLLVNNTNIQRCVLFSYEDRDEEIKKLAACNVDQDTVDTAFTICQDLVQSNRPFGEPLFSTDAQNDPRFMDLKSVKFSGIVSLAVIPLKYKKLLLGFLYVDNLSYEEMFTQPDLEFLVAYGNQISIAIHHGKMREQLVQENLHLKREIQGSYQFSEIIGKSPQMMALFQLMKKVLNTPSSVLITGESGTGKELVARAIHYNGNRASQPFIAHFCGAFSENLLESELFGHVKGSFTGAISDRMGLLEASHGGTLFLDEIAEISPSIQVKLLRFLQEGEIRPVGSSHVMKVDVRILSATNKDLEKEVKEGRFREDLYYRLKVLIVNLPPLREREGDIPVLSHHFLNKYNRKINKQIAGFSPETMEILERYDWPGNVRELENTIESAVNLADNGDRIYPEHLSAKIRSVKTILKDVKSSGSLKKILEQVEREIISEVLLKQNWNKTRTATELGISRQNLIQKINKYKIRRI